MGQRMEGWGYAPRKQHRATEQAGWYILHHALVVLSVAGRGFMDVQYIPEFVKFPVSQLGFLCFFPSF